MLVVGNKKCMLNKKEKFKEHFDVDEVKELSEYVGCKIDVNIEQGRLKIMQPVLIQSLEDKFDLTKVLTTITLAIPGSVLKPLDAEDVVKPECQTMYCSRLGKLLHMMHWL